MKKHGNLKLGAAVKSCRGNSLSDPAPSTSNPKLKQVLVAISTYEHLRIFGLCGVDLKTAQTGTTPLQKNLIVEIPPPIQTQSEGKSNQIKPI